MGYRGWGYFVDCRFEPKFARQIGRLEGEKPQRVTLTEF